MRRQYLPLGVKVAFIERAASCVRAVEHEVDEIGRETVVAQKYGTIDKRDWPRITTAGKGVLRARSLHPEGHGGLRFELPTEKRLGRPVTLTRWVIRWVEPGEGYVAGLTFRSDGYREGDYDPEYGSDFWLTEIRRTPLYEIKTSLRARPFLVPVGPEIGTLPVS